ncbi:MAG: site-specific DNA-methyltransferase [Hormoscilla sp. SP5CHS1]|nr:site-specific DNA-methyltransferase [Hormoscilla sp. SP5CHS1]
MTMDKEKLPLDKIFLGNCLNVLKELPDGCVDLVVSSPPYNLGKEYEAKQALDNYLREQTIVLKECSRILKQTGALFWQIGAFSDRGMLIPLDIRFFPIIESCGLIPRNRIIWARQHGLHAQNKFSCRHEIILWFTKSKDYTFNLDEIRVPQKYQNKKHYRGDRKGQLSCNRKGKNPGDIWLFRNVKHNHEEQTIHPCQFPEDLIARIILATTYKNEVVFDPYMGAGTVAVVARDWERHFIGAEMDPTYHQIAMRRLSGEPDENGCFPNLKTLRNYVERTGEPIDKFRFDVQIGKRPSERSKAKIYPEEYHLQEMEERLYYEEAAFAADLRGEERPVDSTLNGKGKKTPEKTQVARSADGPKNQQLELDL